MPDSPSHSHSRTPHSGDRSKSNRSDSRSVSHSSSYRSSSRSSRSRDSSNFLYERSRGRSSSYSRSDSYSKSSSADYSSDGTRSHSGSRRESYRRFNEKHHHKEHGTHLNKRIVIVGITRNIKKSHLREIFGAYGSITEIFIPSSRNGFSLDGYPCNRSISYIEFSNRESAEEAISAMNGGMIDGSEVRVEFATDERQSPPARRYGGDHRVGRLSDGRNGRNVRGEFNRGSRYDREGYNTSFRSGGRRDRYSDKYSHRYSNKNIDSHRTSRKYASP